MKLVMNENGQLGHASESAISGGVFKIISAPSVKGKAPTNAQGIYRGPLSYTFSGGSATGYDAGTIATLVPQVIAPTAVKSLLETLAVIREGDAGVMIAQGTVSGVPTAIAGGVEVVSAGQTKVQAN